VPRLSVITINLNNAAGLTKTIDSVINQSFTDVEYIIIDGGSTDGSLDIINKYSQKLSYWISEKDTGIYNAMNKGIRKARGHYLMFLNSGDWLLNPGVLEEAFKSSGNADILYGNTINYNGAKGEYKEVRFPEILTFDYFLTSSIPHPSSLIKRELFEKYGLYNENFRIVSDWEFFVLTIIKYNVTYFHLELPVSVFDTNGISENPANKQLMVSEVKESLSRHFPNFLPDYVELHRLRKELDLMKKKFMLKIKHSLIRNRYTRYILNKLN
jgi:glycosyltransferase involved in cell wall biosynthesis